VNAHPDLATGDRARDTPPPSWSTWKGEADPRAVVLAGRARFTVLTPRLVRLEWDPRRRFEDRSSLTFVHRRLDPPPFTVSREGGRVMIETSVLRLVWNEGDGDTTAEGKSSPADAAAGFTDHNLSITFDWDKASQLRKREPASRVDAVIDGDLPDPDGGRVSGRGTGERRSSSPEVRRVHWTPSLEQTRNLGGTTCTLDATHGAVGVTLESGVLSRDGWTLIDDSRRLLLDFASDEGLRVDASAGGVPWVTRREARSGGHACREARPGGHEGRVSGAGESADSGGGVPAVADAGGATDWYFFAYGDDYRGALGDFVKIAGSVPLPPRSAFGLWWSRYWAYSDDEIRALVREFRDHGVPLDVLVIDMDWHTTDSLSFRQPVRDAAGELIGWTGYTWNRELFPDPARLLRWLREQGLKVTLNLHPASGIPVHEERFAEFVRAIHPSNAPPQGAAPAQPPAPALTPAAVSQPPGEASIPLELASRRWMSALFDVVLRPLERMGVDFWWLDWQAGRTVPGWPGLDPVFWLNHVFFCEAERRGDRRPLLFHRWGGLGNHRYQIGFSGDTASSWAALEFQPGFTATAANVAYGYWSHDLGGHHGEDRDPELYLRWLQYGVLSPIVRVHSTKVAGLDRRFWRQPFTELLREAVLFRYALIPYLYTAARIAHDTGVSLCRPLYYSEPGREEAYEAPGEYFVGEDLLAAPVTAKTDRDTGLAHRRIWLPPGRWYEWWSGALLHGDQTHRRAFTLDEIPLYARAGAVIPLSSAWESARSAGGVGGRAPSGGIALVCVPGGDGRTRLYEDDGETCGYRSGEFAWTTIEHRATASGRSITIHPPEGDPGFCAGERSWEIRLPAVLPPRRVLVNGRECGWTYDGHGLAARIITPELPRSAAVEVSVEVDELSALDGSIPESCGLLRRLAGVALEAKVALNEVDPVANPPSAILRGGSLARRLSYFPHEAAGAMRSLPGLLRDVVGALAEHPGRHRDLAPLAARLQAGAPGLDLQWKKPEIHLAEKPATAINRPPGRPAGEPAAPGDSSHGAGAPGDRSCGEQPFVDRSSVDMSSVDMSSVDMPAGDMPAGGTSSGDTSSGDTSSGDTSSGDTSSGGRPAAPEPFESDGVVVATLRAERGTRIRYTLDGSLPGPEAPLYREPLELRRTLLLRCRAEGEGRAGSFAAMAALHRRVTRAIRAVKPCRPDGAPIEALVDGRFGVEHDISRDWCFWQGTDMVVEIDLVRPLLLSSVRARFLRHQRAGIFLPVSITIDAAETGGPWFTLADGGGSTSKPAPVRQTLAGPRRRGLRLCRWTGTFPSGERRPRRGNPAGPSWSMSRRQDGSVVADRHAPAGTFREVPSGRPVEGSGPEMGRAQGGPSLGMPSLGGPSLGMPSLGGPSLGMPSLGAPSPSARPRPGWSRACACGRRA